MFMTTTMTMKCDKETQQGGPKK